MQGQRGIPSPLSGLRLIQSVKCDSRVWVQGLPLSASELNLAAWADPGASQAVAAGDLSIVLRNFSLSDLP